MIFARNNKLIIARNVICANLGERDLKILLCDTTWCGVAR